MVTFKNAELRHAGNVIRTNVEVDSYVPLTGPLAREAQWTGVLRPPNNTGLALGETYTLVLPDHSPVKIEITGEANPEDGSVTFKGIGNFQAKALSREVQNAR